MKTKTATKIYKEAMEKRAQEDIIGESFPDLCRKDALALYKHQSEIVAKLIDEEFSSIWHGV